MGLMSLGLNLETNIKIGIPLNNVDYYLFISCLTILFYLFAYKIPKNVKVSKNPRTKFYIEHRISVYSFNIIIWLTTILSGVSILLKVYENLLHLHWLHYVVLAATLFLSTSYYNWKYGLSLRKYTWFKPTLIAWTWAITTVYLPILILDLEGVEVFYTDARFYFLFTQTFMYFIVNAIMFDMKDYEDDTNWKLKTFVVKYGYSFTLNRIIIPLTFLGFLSFLGFGIWYELPWHRTIFMLIPIVILAIFAYQLNRPKSILFYLVVIDGMILVKAIFGILSVLLFE